MALGENLRLAREAKGQSISQVAEATRMMVQIVEDLERENFRRIAAPIYGRGFIKLYAEYLGLDPDPLLREFMEIYTGSRPPQVVRRPMEDSQPFAPAADLPDSLTPVSHSGAADRTEGLAGQTPDEPDLFSMAAGRSEAIGSVADPAQSGETAPPRVRPAPSRTISRAPVPGPSSRQEPAKSRYAAAADGEPAASDRRGSGDWIPPHWTPAIIGAIAAIILLLLLLGVYALSKKAGKAHGSKSHAIKVERVLKPAAPYFD